MYSRLRHHIFSLGRFLAVLALLVLVVVEEGYGQRVYADIATTSGSTLFVDHVQNPERATNSNPNEFARVRSYGGVLLGGGAFSGYLNLMFSTFPDGSTKIPAGTTTFIRLGGNAQDLLNVLLGGSLGSALADVLGLVLLGNHFFEISILDGSNIISSNDSQTGFKTNQFRIVHGKDGYFYAAVTPDFAYDGVRIRDANPAIALGTFNSTDVYYAFYFEDIADCESDFYTSYDATGINLDLLNLTNSAADSIHQSIDGDINTYSKVSPGLLSLGGSISQFFYFGNASPANSTVSITLGAAPSVLNLDVISSISLVAYNGTTQVYTTNLSSLLGLDLLGLLQSGIPVSFSLKPTAEYDRLEIKFNQVLGLGTGESLRIYEVSRSPMVTIYENPELQNILTGCGEVDLSKAIANYQPDHYDYRYYTVADGGTALPSSLVSTSGTYYIEAVDPVTGCASERVEVSATVFALPEITLSAVPAICEGEITAVITYSNLQNGANEYRIAWDNNAVGFTDVSYTDLSGSPIVISVPASAAIGEYTATLTVKNTETGCESIGYPFTVTVLPQPGRPHLTITDVQN